MKMTEKEYSEKMKEWDDRPDWDKVFEPREDLPPKIFSNGYECKCFGIITYKGCKYPVYTDDDGMQDFIIYRFYNEKHEIEEYNIPVQNFAGYVDWWFELNRMKFEYPDEIVS